MATSFYRCPNPQVKQKFCIFENLSQCAEQEAESICNKHFHIVFKLIAKQVDYTSVSNNHTTKLETYNCSNTKLKIMLFVDLNDGKVLMGDILQYSRYIVDNNKNQGINEIKLADILGYYLGLNAFNRVTDFTFNSWLNDPGAYIGLMVGKTITYVEAKCLPPLYRRILAHTRPSFYYNKATKNKRVFLENLCLMLDESSNKYAFTSINDEVTLKYTNNKNCVATPLTLMAIHIDYQENKPTLFQPSSDITNCL